MTRRGLHGVKLVISDAHEGIKAAVTKVLCATWQRCRVHFMRNVLAHAGKSGRRVASVAAPSAGGGRRISTCESKPYVLLPTCLRSSIRVGGQPGLLPFRQQVTGGDGCLPAGRRGLAGHPAGAGRA